MRRFFLLVALLLGLGAATPAEAQPDRVIVNGLTLTPDMIGALGAHYGIQVQPGSYWYDPTSGAWGYAGGPTVSFLPAGIPSAPLQADASNGRTNVWVNGRRLPAQDLRALQNLTGPIQPGRYWLDGWGNAGYEGGPALVNLAQLAQQSGRRGTGGDAFHRSGVTDTGSNSSGGSGYIMGRDWSVSW